jgi:hypothetical protein
MPPLPRRSAVRGCEAGTCTPPASTQNDEITGIRDSQFQELAEVRHELSEVHDRLDILVLRVNKRDRRHAADQAVIEELRVDKQEMIDVNKRRDYLVEIVNK